MKYARALNWRKQKIMIKSMTGFGRSEVSETERKVTAEIKSVNHRYLDVNIKMPKKLSFFEAAIRTELKKVYAAGESGRIYYL